MTIQIFTKSPSEQRAENEGHLHWHLEHHNVKQWLLDGAKKEDARTIYEAVKEMPQHRLVRRLARILAQ